MRCVSIRCEVSIEDLGFNNHNSIVCRPVPIMLIILPIILSKNFAHHLLIITYYSHKILLTILMQVILELNDCSIRVYQSFWQSTSNNYSSSFSHNYLMHALNHCYQVAGQYLKHHAQKRPKILKLCLRVSYNFGIILLKVFIYYSNYAGIIA